MWCVVVSGLPLGVTPSQLRRSLEEAINERPVWPQQAKIYEDEALVYTPARDTQSKLSSTTVKVRVNGTVVSVKKLNQQQAQQWLDQRKPGNTNYFIILAQNSYFT